MSAENKIVTFGSGTREIPAQKASKWYPAEEEPVNKKVGYFFIWYREVGNGYGEMEGNGKRAKGNSEPLFSGQFQMQLRKRGAGNFKN